MFDVASSEVIIVGMVALLVIPPKDLPKAMRFAGHWIGKVRGIATQFRSGFDTMVREAELVEMEKRWAEENERIMREHPPTPPSPMLLPRVEQPTVAQPPVEQPPVDDGVGEPQLVEAPAIAHGSGAPGGGDDPRAHP